MMTSAYCSNESYKKYFTHFTCQKNKKISTEVNALIPQHRARQQHAPVHGQRENYQIVQAPETNITIIFARTVRYTNMPTQPEKNRDLEQRYCALTSPA